MHHCITPHTSIISARTDCVPRANGSQTLRLRSVRCLAWSCLFALSASAAPTEALERVATRRILFGHQSVGANLVEGLAALGAAHLVIKEGRDPGAFVTPAFVHTRVGRNEDPASKVADFEAALEAIGGRADIALFKFCYVDFSATTDVDALFGTYVAALQRLHAKYPAVTFVHVTAPLTVVQSGPVAWLKRVLGKAPGGARENAVRHHYNELLRTRLAGEPLFDLAQAEATKADGSLNTVELDGEQVPALVAAWSDDGQHLNGEGRARVARALITRLGSIP